MENSKIYELVTFAFLATINDNLRYIYNMGTVYNEKLSNISQNKNIKKVITCIKDISKDLFK